MLQLRNRRGFRHFLGASVAVFLLIACPAARAESARDPADVVREADAAFDADQHDRALALYQEALASDPQNLRALRRAGLLLGWAGRAKEAVPLLEKAVRLEPEDRPTKLQLARVYSWDRQWDPSLAAYDALLKEDPSDVSTAVERARVLAWAGRLQESEQSYRAILAAHPDSSEAKLGLAQTIGWEGRLDEASAMYREELARSPSGARLGLARIDLLRDNASEALRTARAELARDPKSEEAHEIENAALALLRPSLAGTVELTDDTDENRNLTVTATGSFHAIGALDIDVTAGWMGQEGRDAEIQRLAGIDLDTAAPGRQRPSDPNELHDLSSEWVGVAAGFGSQGTRTTIAVTAERLGTYGRPDPLDDRGDRTTLSGYAAFRYIAPVTVRVTVAHEIPRWTAFITERDLRWDHAVVGVDGRLPWNLDWAAVGDWGRITGGAEENNRLMALGTLGRRFDLGRGWSLTPRYAFRWLSYEHNLNDGYFDPQSYYSNVVGLVLGGVIDAGKFEWTLGASVGLERFRHEAEDVSVCEVFDDIDADYAAACRSGVVLDTDPIDRQRAAGYLQGEETSETNTILGFLGRFLWNIREGTSVEVYAAHDESAAQTASGFESNTYGVTGRVRF